MKRIVRSFLFLSIYGLTSLALAEVNDFDRVCDFFSELGNQKNLKTMNHIQRNDFIVERINKHLSTTSDARVAWEAVAATVAGQRYEIYRSGAESVLNRKWECPAMEKLAIMTGLFE